MHPDPPLMGCYAEITYVWADGSRVELEVSSDQDAHPDLLDELTKRVLELYRETCVAGDDVTDDQQP